MTDERPRAQTLKELNEDLRGLMQAGDMMVRVVAFFLRKPEAEVYEMPFGEVYRNFALAAQEANDIIKQKENERN